MLSGVMSAAALMSKPCQVESTAYHPRSDAGLMRWITEERAPGGEWEVLGGPYKTLPLAKRCARQRLQVVVEEKLPTPQFRIKSFERSIGPDAVVPLSLIHI